MSTTELSGLSVDYMTGGDAQYGIEEGIETTSTRDFTYSGDTVDDELTDPTDFEGTSEAGGTGGDGGAELETQPDQISGGFLVETLANDNTFQQTDFSDSESGSGGGLFQGVDPATMFLIGTIVVGGALALSNRSGGSS